MRERLNVGLDFVMKLRIAPDDRSRLERQANLCGLAMSTLARLMILHGLRSLEDAGDKTGLDLMDVLRP